MKRFFFIILTGALWVWGTFAEPRESEALSRLRSLFPAPRSMEIGPGVLDIRSGISVSASDGILSSPLVSRLDALAQEAGIGWSLHPGRIPLLLVPQPRLAPEAYELRIGTGQIVVAAGTEAGFFYALVTLQQLLSPRGERPVLPVCTLQDGPEFSWRGLMVDSSRHFQPVAKLKEVLERMALHKLNRFHWHLSDDQGWRLEIPALPALTRVGAWRREADGTRYGGFYTTADVKELLAFASDRMITVVPEIEVPGHSWAALAAYPELSASGKPTEVPADWAVSDGVLCLGKKSVDDFLEKVSSAVLAQFPGPWIHWGGDEVYRHPWLRNKESQDWMKAQGVGSNSEVEAVYWNRLAEKTLQAGKIPLGWEEILAYKPAKSTLLQWWDNPEVGAQALKSGYRIIASWKLFTYLDYPEEAWDADRQDWMLLLDSRRVAQFSPWPSDDLTPEQKKNLVGVEACLWTEHAPPENMDRKLFPRLAVFAEIAWRGRAADRWEARLALHRLRLESWGVGMAPPVR